MVQKKYEVRLSSEEKRHLRKVVRSGRSSAQAVTRDRIPAEYKRGLDEVLHRRNQVNRYRKLDERGEAHLIALACTTAPEGHDHWTLRVLAGKTVELGLVESLSHETVRTEAEETRSSPRSATGQAVAEETVVHTPGRADSVAHLKDVVELYAEPYDHERKRRR